MSQRFFSDAAVTPCGNMSHQLSLLKKGLQLALVGWLAPSPGAGRTLKAGLTKPGPRLAVWEEELRRR